MAGAVATGAAAPTPQAEVDATAKADQLKKDASDRQAQVARANDAEGTITIQTTRAFHFAHPGIPSQGVTVRPNTPTIVPAWVEHSDTWGLATAESRIEGIAPQIQVLKDAKPGTVATASVNAGTDAPKTPEQRKLEADAAAAVLAQYDDADERIAAARAARGLKPVPVESSTEDPAKKAADDKATADEQAERLKQQKGGAKSGDDPNKAALEAGANAQKSGDAAKTAQK